MARITHEKLFELCENGYVLLMEENKKSINIS